MKERKKIQPINDVQENIVRSNCDLIFLTGSGGGGKTFNALLSFAKDIKMNKDFRACALRKSLVDAKAAGSILDTLKKIYPLKSDKDRGDSSKKIGSIKMSDSPSATFYKGGMIDVTHIENETKAELEKRMKGRQYHKFFVDEVDSFKFKTVIYLLTRGRGEGDTKSQLITANNPERQCWVRIMEGMAGGGWVDDEGNIIDEMNGVVRYFVITGDTPESCVWGKTKKEVYQKARAYIEPKIKAAHRRGIKITYESYILSATHIEPSVYDNKALLKENPNYLAMLTSSGAAKSMLESNHNYSKYDENSDTETIDSSVITSMFRSKTNTSNRPRDMHIISDLAKRGIDNMTILVADGLHVMDMKFIPYCKNNIEQARHIQRMKEKWNIQRNNCIIFDAGGGNESLEDILMGSNGFLSTKSVIGGAKNKRIYYRLKDQCAYILYKVLKGEIPGKEITIEPRLAAESYPSNSLKEGNIQTNWDKTVIQEMVREFALLKFDYDNNNKIKLINKDVMGRQLSGHSPDLMDLFIMLMYPFLDTMYDDIDFYENKINNEFNNPYIKTPEMQEEDIWRNCF